MKRTRVVDVHTHPVFADYYSGLEAAGHLWEDGFPIPRSYSADAHLALMDELGVAWSLLGISSPHPHYGDDAACIRACRSINEQSARIVQDHPGRFGFSAVLPHPCLDAAVEEAVYALDVLGASAVKLASNARGLYMGDAAMEPLFSELDKRDAIITMHPHRPQPMNETVWSAGPVPCFEFLCDTTRAVLNMIAKGVFRRQKRIRLIVPHCGAFLPNIYHRFLALAEFLESVDPADIEDGYRRLYYDCAGDPLPNNLALLLKTADPSRIMYGSDYPFNDAARFAGKLDELSRGMQEDAALRPYREMVLHGNADTLFGLRS